jgi:HK97 family phage portal protein
MGRLTDRLFRRGERETRRYEPSWGLLGAAPYGGQHQRAEGLAAVAASINYTSGQVGSLTPLLYAVDGTGRRVENLTHPTNRVLQRPNAVQTWPEFAELMVSWTLVHGNAVAVLDHDQAGRLVSAMPVPWGMVSVRVLASGAPVYDVSWPGRPPVRYLASEVMHLRDRCETSPYVGVSRLQRAATTIGHAQSADLASSASFERSARPSGVLRISGRHAEDELDRIKARVTATMTGALNAGKTLVLQDGLDFVPFSAVSARDAELLASRVWSVIDVARLFGVPPILIGDWANMQAAAAKEAQTLFANTTLHYWVTRFEAAFNASVFGPTTGATFALQLDMSGLQRADPATRVAADNVLLSHGIITPNECRESWGYSPSSAPGMDEPRQAPQTGGPQLTGTQPGNMTGAPA